MDKKWVSNFDLEIERLRRRPKPHYRTRNQRAIDDARARSAELTLKRDSRWRCGECGEWHYDGEECPLTSAAIIQHIEHHLGRATVQKPGGGLSYWDGVLHSVAHSVNGWAEKSEAANEVRESYLRHPVLGPFLRGEIKERGFWDEDKRKTLNPKTVSWETGGAAC